MTGDEVTAAYQRIHGEYVRVSDVLAGADTDFAALAQVLAGIDAEFAALPAASSLSGLDPDLASRLAAVARQCDVQRHQALATLIAAQARLTNTAAGDERAARAAQAYRTAEGPSDGRFIDHRR